ncbi:MAG TPA: hypothetical protein VFC78_00265 [Tepidisphaeraceae bacterium]|nr:hypothetical protein [Tepidisphaeraceae bacterium]
MKNVLFTAVLGLSLAGTPFLTGCDRHDKPAAVHEKDTTTTNPNGTQHVDKEKTTVEKNGDTKKTEVHKDNP